MIVEENPRRFECLPTLYSIIGPADYFGSEPQNSFINQVNTPPLRVIEVKGQIKRQTVRRRHSGAVRVRHRHTTVIPTYYSQDFRARFGGRNAQINRLRAEVIELFAYRQSEVVGYFCFDRLHQQSWLILECTLTFCNPLDVRNGHDYQIFAPIFGQSLGSKKFW
jgi:hypothetical protein